MATLAKGTMFPEVLVSEMFNKVKGHSSLARLSEAKPIPFVGAKEMTFTLDREVDIVAENGAKSAGGATVAPVTITPIKFEYSMRTSDEFLYATEEYKLNIMQQFADGFAKKLARGMDLAAFHGVNPRTSSASAVVGTNNFDSAVQTTVTYAAANADANLDSAVQAVQAAGGEVNGIAMAPAFSAALAAIKVNGVPQYPEFRFGQNPGSFYGMGADVNKTVSDASSLDRAIVGDFQNAFKWGYAKEIPLEVIEYGNPDNDADAGDLKGHNQVLLRCEAYIGWGILDAAAFARITATT